MGVILFFTGELIVASLMIYGLYKARVFLGLAPLFVFLGGIQFLQTILNNSMQVKIFDIYSFSPGSTIFFSTSIFAILLLYIKEGVAKAQSLIFGIIISNLLLAGIVYLTSFEKINFDDSITLNPVFIQLSANGWLFFIGTATLLVDFFITTIIYKFLITKIRRLGLFLIILISIFLVLIFDSLIYVSLTESGSGNYANLLLNDLISKIYSGTILSIILFVILKANKKLLQSDTGYTADKTDDIFAILDYRKKYERLQIEKQVSEKQLTTKLENSLNSMTDGFVSLDKNWKYIFVNKTAAKIFNRDPAYLVGKNIWQEFPEGIGQPFNLAYEKAMATQQYIYLEEHYEPYNLWFENHIYPSPNGLAIYFSDISTRKIAELELQKTSQRLNYHLNNSPLAVIEWDKAFRITKWSKAAETIFKWKEEEVLNKHFDDIQLAYEKNSDNTRQVVADLLEGRVKQNTVENRNYTKSGELLYCRWYNSVLTDENGKVVSIMSLVNDITETKEAELKITASEKKFRYLTEHSESLYSIIDKNMNTVFRSASAERITGWSHAEYEVMNPADFVHPDDVNKMQETFRHSLTNPGIAVQFKLRILHKAGYYIIMEGVMKNLLDDADIGGLIVNMRDITEREKNAEAILNTNERFELISNITQDVLRDWNLKTNEVWWNNNYFSLFGYDSLEIQHNANTWVENIHPDDRQRVSEGIQKAFDSGLESWSDKYKYLKANGDFVNVYDRGVILYDEAGNPFRIIGSMVDITHQKIAEEKISNSEKRYRTLIQNGNDMIGLFDENRQYIYVNQVFEKVTGYSFEEMQKNPSLSLIHPDDMEKAMEIFKQVIANPGVIFNDQYRIINKNGETIWIEGSSQNLLQDENIKAVVRNYRDITKRKLAEAQILKERDFSNAQINSLPGVFYLYNQAGQFLKWNENFEKITGYTSDEIENLHPLDLFAEQDKQLLTEKIGNVFVKGEDAVEANFLTKSGALIPYLFTGKAIDYNGEKCLLGVGIDISKRFQAEEELRQLATHLQSIREEERKRIGRDIHDDLGQKLTAIKMDISWLEENIDTEKDVMKAKLKKVNSELDSSNDSVKRILNELRIDLLEHHNLVDALQWLVDQFIVNTGIQVEFACFDDQINANEQITTCIFRVFQEALNNITKYAKAKQVEISLNYEDGHLVLIINDDGIGFDRTLIKKNKSFGILGMKERVTSVQGTFEITSKAGSGTTIFISIPFKENNL